MSERSEITVGQLSKFGFQTPEGEYVNFSKLFKDHELVQPNTVLSADVYTAPSGKRYLNKVFSTIKADGGAAVAVAEKPKAKAKKAVDSVNVPAISPLAEKPAYTPRDFDKEARGKTMAMMVSAALQAPAVSSYSDDLTSFVDNVLVVAQKAFSMVFKGEEYNG